MKRIEGEKDMEQKQEKEEQKEEQNLKKEQPDQESDTRIHKIVQAEWEMFDRVSNAGVCQPAILLTA